MSILREPISSITHLIAGGLSVVALVLLISKQLILGNVNEMLFISSIIF